LKSNIFITTTVRTSNPTESTIVYINILPRPALGPIQPQIQWAPGVVSQGVQRQGREAGHSPPFSAVVKNAPSISLHGVVLN
jgi:hypothetical protein